MGGEIVETRCKYCNKTLKNNEGYIIYGKDTSRLCKMCYESSKRFL